MEVDIDKKVKISRLLDLYGGLLSDRQREICALCYDDDLSLSEIASLTGITRQGVRDARRRAEAILFAYEEKLGLLARFDSVSKRLDGIKTLLGSDSPLTPERRAEIIAELDRINV